MKVLRNTRGASLLFVLAITFLLLSIGVSVLTAAGANYGVTLTQRDRSQLEIYVSSMERVINKVIEQEEDTFGGFIPTIDNSQTLLGEVLLRIAEEAIPEKDGNHEIAGNISMSTRLGIETITLPYITVAADNELLRNVEYDVVISWEVIARVPEVIRCQRNSIYDEQNNEIDYWVDTCDIFSVNISGHLVSSLTTRYTNPSGTVFTMTTNTTYLLDEIRIEEDDACLYPALCNRQANMEINNIRNMRIINLPARSIMQHEKKGIG